MKPLILWGFNCLVNLFTGLVILSKRDPSIEIKFGKWPERSVTRFPEVILCSLSLVKILSISEMMVPFLVKQTLVGRSIHGKKEST